MKTQMMGRETGPAAAPPVRPRWRGLAAGVVALVLVAVSVLAWEWRHPKAFPDAAGDVGQTNDAWPVGEPLFVGVTFGQDEAGAVTLIDAEPVVEQNSAGAQIEYFVCVPAQPNSGSIASSESVTAEEHCGLLEAIGSEPVEFKLSDNRQVLMRITPYREGAVEIPSSDLTYHDGWRTGTQRVGDGIRIRAVRQ